MIGQQFRVETSAGDITGTCEKCGTVYKDLNKGLNRVRLLIKIQDHVCKAVE